MKTWLMKTMGHKNLVFFCLSIMYLQHLLIVRYVIETIIYISACMSLKPEYSLDSRLLMNINFSGRAKTNEGKIILSLWVFCEWGTILTREKYLSIYIFKKNRVDSLLPLLESKHEVSMS